jgi:hypothetical protein
MFRKALIRLGVSLVLVASVTVLATASGGSAGLTFVVSHQSYSHDGSSPPNPCPGPGVNERHYCLVVTNYDNLKQSGGVEVDVTLQNYDQSSLTNPVTHLRWTDPDLDHHANLSFVSSSGPATCSSAVPTPPAVGQVDCTFPNLPGLGSAAGSGPQTPCPVPPVPSGPICSTVKLFFTAAATAPSVDFSATADVKESNPQNGANLDQQAVDQAVMAFDTNTGAGADADATVALPQTAALLQATKSSVKFIGGSNPFLAQFQQSQLQPTSPGVCFPGIGCTGLQLTTDLAGAPTGTFSNTQPIVWTATVNATNTNVVAVHYYDPVTITGSPTTKTFTTSGTRFASCDGVNFGSSPGGDVVANKDYFVINAATSGGNTTFQVASTATGKPLKFDVSGPFSGSCIREIGDQKTEKTAPCTATQPPATPAQLPALCAVKTSNSTVLVYLLDDANGRISY